MITYERKHRRLYECLKNARAGASAQCDLILSSATISASVKGQLPERALALLAEPSVITCSATFSASVKAHMPERVHSVQLRMRVEPLPHRALALLVEMHFFLPLPLSPSSPPGGDLPPELPLLNQEGGGWHPESGCPPMDSHSPYPSAVWLDFLVSGYIVALYSRF